MSDFNIIEVDSATLYNEVILALEKAVGEPLYPMSVESSEKRLSPLLYPFTTR